MKRNPSQAFTSILAGRLCQRILLLSLSVAFCLCLMLATERRAYAYINPGDGLLALQSLFAGLAAFGYFMRRRLAAIFSRNSRSKRPVAVPSTSPTGACKDDTRNAA